MIRLLPVALLALLVLSALAGRAAVRPVLGSAAGPGRAASPVRSAPTFFRVAVVVVPEAQGEGVDGTARAATGEDV